VRISRALHDELVEHARAEAPNECCGVVASQDGQAVKVFRATNVHASPLRYEIEPGDLLRIYKATEEAGWTWGAIYHSHTRSAPYPSQTDVNLAFPLYPDEMLYVIVGIANPEEPEVRAYRIADGSIEEAELEVE
jgi:proteasome lid subunit RPN8/RPN11